MPREDALTEQQLRRLLEVGQSLVSELDLESLLRQVLETARDLTDASYAALGILDFTKTNLERFLHLGIDDETRKAIGPLPKGRGVLGELIRNPAPLRLAEVGDHARSYGFPPGHPPMHTFVGVPIQIRGEAFGNIYLTEKAGGGEFDDRDETLLVILADWAAIAIDNARVYEQSERRRGELERAVQALEATVSLARVGAVETDLDSLLELIAKRGRALVEADSLLVLLDAGPSQELGTVAGSLATGAIPASIPTDEPELVAARAEPTVRYLQGTGVTLHDSLGIDQSRALAIVHMDYRGRSQGFLIAVDPGERSGFDADATLVFSAFAGSAANSLATAQDVERDRMNRAIEAAEQERRRWAMELHDETLQELGALKVIAESALSRADPDEMRESLTGATAQLERTIIGLESLINELRPASLDELGIAAAIETLVERMQARADLAIECSVDLAHERGDEPSRHSPRLESALYRIVQEALNNAAKHSQASKVTVTITEGPDTVDVVVADDGKGFDPETSGADRFGLHGMRERIELLDGSLRIDSAPGSGTRIEASLPLERVA